jgi:DNA polymerase III sliding clamp (beta) subunit (PCNA family)
MEVIKLKNGGRADPDFHRWRQLLTCVGKDKMRPELNYVLIEMASAGMYAVGCDGLRLRRDLFKIKAEPGLYEIEVNNVREIRLVQSQMRVRYPDYRKVIPSLESETTYSVRWGAM